MALLADLFPDTAPINPSADPAARADWLAIPAKGAVYLLTAESDHPVLLATVGDLRAALKRRLADTPADAKSKRIEYGRLCTRIHWREVHSPFAADYWYAHAAHALFPDTAAALIPWRASWWIAVERPGGGCDFPRFRKTINLSDPALAYAGPVRDKHAANRLIETLEDLFDLCRYHNILMQAPHGKSCAYKEMGKCPAPCDGSVSLAHYHQQITAALHFASSQKNRDAWRADLEMQMAAAARNLHFEQAARLKQRLTRAAALDADPFKHLAALEDFSFLSLQPGRTKTILEPWLIHAGQITTLQPIENQKSKIKNLPAAAHALFETCRSAAPIKNQKSKIENPIALLSHHLFKGAADPGLCLRRSDILAQGPGLILTAATRLLARKAPPKPLPELATDTLPSTPLEPADAPDVSVEPPS